MSKLSHVCSSERAFIEFAEWYYKNGPNKFPIEITLKPWKSTRSNAQNALYWGCWLPLIAKTFGYTPEELHEILKAEWGKEFREPQYIKYNGKTIEKPFSTADLKVDEFTGWLNKLEQLATNQNITLPYPEDLYGLAQGQI